MKTFWILHFVISEKGALNLARSAETLANIHTSARSAETLYTTYTLTLEAPTVEGYIHSWPWTCIGPLLDFHWASIRFILDLQWSCAGPWASAGRVLGATLYLYWFLDWTPIGPSIGLILGVYLKD